MFKRVFGIVIMIICTSVFMWCADGYVKSRNSGSVDLSDIATNTSSDILIWYIDSEVEPYLEEVSSSYRNGVTIDYEQKSLLEFFENINKLNVAGERTPDIYIIDSELLEKACYAGLAKENTYDDIYTTDEYSQTALSAATYKDKLYGYPLSFKTSFLLYNEDYVEDGVYSFDDILTYANETDISVYNGVENILKWDVSNLLYNYGFWGSYFNIGGKNGDDSSIVDLNSEDAIAALKYYQDMAQFFSIDINTVDYDTILDEFTAGTNVFMIAGIDSLEKINSSGINYKIKSLPNISEELETTSLSATKLAVVNPYSTNTGVAEKIAKYMTYDNSEKIYEAMGTSAGTRILSSYDTDGLEEIMEQYEDSKSLPKLMSTSDIWIQLQNTMNSIWTGADVTTAANALQEKYSK